MPPLDKNKKHSIFVVVDRLQMPNEDADIEEFKSRLYSSFEGSLRLVPGSVFQVIIFSLDELSSTFITDTFFRRWF